MSLFKELTTQLRREMNGAVSGTMRKLDPNSQRKINFGVSLPTIRQICTKYEKDHALAEELRGHDVREWWLAAAYIDTPATVDVHSADLIASGWISEEEANVYAMALLSHSPFALEIASGWIASREKLKTVAANRIVACLAEKISDSMAEMFLKETSAEIAVRAIYEHHPTLRPLIRENGPYNYSWILDEIDNANK